MHQGGIQPTERQVQRSILDMMGTCFPDVFVHHSPNGAHLAGNDTARFKQMGALLGDGLKKGFPDLICLWAVCQGAFIEVKRPKTGKLSEDQFQLHARLLSLGWRVKTVSSVEDAYAFLIDCGAPCKARLAA
jgi:hypothetical protein